MNAFLWVLQGLLALTMLAAGAMKVAKSPEDLATDPQLSWAEGFSASTVRFIGMLELAAAIGLVLPWAVGIAPILTPLAAVGVVLLMIGAAATHWRRGEVRAVVRNAVIAALAVALAIGRFGDL